MPNAASVEILGDSKLQEIGHEAVLDHGVTERERQVDLIAVVSTVLLPAHVAGLLQVCEGPVGGPLGDPRPLRDVGDGRVGMPCDRD